jgi:hypothetical protein
MVCGSNVLDLMDGSSYSRVAADLNLDPWFNSAVFYLRTCLWRVWRARYISAVAFTEAIGDCGSVVSVKLSQLENFVVFIIVISGSSSS